MERRYEVELKFRVSDIDTLRAKLSELGATEQGRQRESDTYYRHPCRDFAKTGEAFRIRRIDGVAHVTYKGPKQASEVKTRTELEWSLAPGDPRGESFSQLLEQLGFQPVEKVEKEREKFQLNYDGQHELQVTIDEVQRLGAFAEVEAISGEREVEAAQKRVRSVADRLGLNSPEPRSYLQMVLQQASPEAKST